MTIRETIDGLMTSDAEQAAFKQDRGEYLAERDMGDVPDDLIDTAFVHYADTTSLENADALAPVVTRVGPVPYAEGDLEGRAEGLLDDAQPDPWSLLSFGATTATEADLEDDPAELDDQANAIADPLEPDELPDIQDTSTNFGEGNPAEDQDFDESDSSADDYDPETNDDLDIDPVDAFEEDPTNQQPAASGLGATSQEFGEAEEFSSGLIEELADDDTDPMDLDFD